MESRRFDALSRSLASRMSRRGAIRSAGAGLAATAVGAASRAAAAQGATPASSPGSPTGDKAVFLFVQTATSGSFAPNPGVGTPTIEGTPAPGGGAAYLLTLEGHPGGTVYFSDRPERIFGEAPTQAFLDGLGFDPANPPNAALVTQTDDGAEDVVVLELLSPSYDETTDAITYGATILDDYTGDGLAHVAARQQDAVLPETFGRASLFIDDCDDAVVSCWLDDSSAYFGDLEIIGMCWSFGDFCCKPCNFSESTATSQCNELYVGCSGSCAATISSGCW